MTDDFVREGIRHYLGAVSLVDQKIGEAFAQRGGAARHSLGSASRWATNQSGVQTTVSLPIE